MSKPKADRPETLAQAQEWQRVLTHYVKLGLCHGCASQAAYGTQIGFSRINPPCVACVPIVANFLDNAVGPWRKMSCWKMRTGAYSAGAGAIPSASAPRPPNHMQGAIRTASTGIAA